MAPVRIVYLTDILPKLGFSWDRDGRDAAVKNALINIAGANGRIRRPQALTALERVWNKLCELWEAAPIQRDENMAVWILRARHDANIALGLALEERIWIEFVLRVVDARINYKGETSQAEQNGTFRDLSACAHAVDRFIALVGDFWGRNLAHLNGVATGPVPTVYDEPEGLQMQMPWDTNVEDEDYGLSDVDDKEEEDEDMSSNSGESGSDTDEEIADLLRTLECDRIARRDGQAGASAANLVGGIAALDLNDLPGDLDAMDLDTE
ncbi:hypothetical protein V8F33_010580 [Rhypophila sp. PSN 637]